jgi:Family of unknown function (DUF6297)
MMSTAAAIEVPDSTDATISLLRELRRGHLGRQAANMAYWLYVAGLITLIYGGWLVASIARALRHQEPPLGVTPALLRAAPAGLCALALLALAALLWDARWRGPVTISQATADWLLDTPVRRGRLLHPRYRASVLVRLPLAAVAGLVPAGLLLSVGLGGGAGSSLRLAGTAMLSTAVVAGTGTGLAALIEGRPAWPASRGASAAGLAALAAGLLALLAAIAALPAWVGTALLWSGPWGWAAQGLVALSGGRAPQWPVALALAAAAAGVAIVAGDRAAGRIPAAALRARARVIGNMSAAVANLDARRVGTAYRAMTAKYGRVRFMLAPPLHRELVLPWRDVVALLRAPSRLAWAALLSWAAIGLSALAVHSPHSALLPLAGALSLGYLAAGNLCEGARLDADDTRRSSQLPFRYDSLVWWHAIVPCLTLAVVCGIPAAVLAIATGRAGLLAVVIVAIVVLVGGALVSSYRGPLEAEALSYGFETPFGNTGSILVVLWYATGPLLAVGPLILLTHLAISAPGQGAIPEVVILSLSLAVWLGSIAVRRARKLRKS